MKISLENRVENSVKNISIGLVAQVVQLMSTFVCRIILLRCLAQEYIGINGLFTSVMGMLSIAELGIGSAMSYELYRALAKEDTTDQASLMALYKKLYSIIGLIICFIGILILPIITLSTNNYPNVSENVYFIYILFLLSEVLSYIFTYRETIIYAAQSSHILTVLDVIFGVLRNTVQCILLIFTHSFTIYIIIQVLFRIFYNFAAFYTAKKMFPNAFNNKNIVPINKERKSKIFHNIRYIFTEKIATQMLNSTDNIISSSICGLVVTAINSNYSMIITTIYTFTQKFQNAITAVTGNISTIETKEKQRKALYEIYLIYFWIYLICSISFALLVQETSKLIFGQEYVQSFSIGLITAVNFLQSGMLIAVSTFRSTMGLFKYGKYTTIFTSIINIVLSLILGKYYGLFGILIATTIAKFITVDWYYPYVTFKYGFDGGLLDYYLYTLRKWLEAIFIFFITFEICKLINMDIIGNIVFKLLICITVPNLLIILINIRNSEFRSIVLKLKNYVISKRSKTI